MHNSVFLYPFPTPHQSMLEGLEGTLDKCNIIPPPIFSKKKLKFHFWFCFCCFYLVHIDFYHLLCTFSFFCFGSLQYLLPFGIAAYFRLVFVTTTVVLVFIRSPHQVGLPCLFPSLKYIQGIPLYPCFGP